MSFLGIAAPAIGGALVSGLFGRSNAKHEAGLSRDNWIYQQSNAHQLEVQDLKNAGLNPILSATNSQMANMSPVHGSDYGAGQAFTSAIQGALDREAKQKMQANELEIERTRAEIERSKAETEKFRAEAEARLWSVQANYYSSKQVNETNEATARIAQINQDIKNSIKLTDAEATNLYSGAALNNRLADKVIYDIEKVVADTEYSKINTQELKRILTDPKREIERKTWADALKGDNMLGALHKLNIIGSEIGGMFPSRIGFGFSSKK